MPAALDAGIGLLPWLPLAGGWLSEKYSRDVAPTGARTGHQLTDNLGAAGVRLAPQEMRRLTDASAPTIDGYPYGAGGIAQRDRRLAGGR